MKKKIVIILIVLLLLIAYNRNKILAYFESDPFSNSNKSILELQGNIEIRESHLSFLVSGRISSIDVDEGDSIKKGMLLAELEPDYYNDSISQISSLLESKKALYKKLENGSRTEEIKLSEASLKMVKVSLENAKIEYERAIKLHKKDALSEQGFDKAKTEYKKLKAQLDVSKANLSLIKSGARVEDLKAAEAAVKQVEAQLKEAKRRLSDTSLYSPVSGIIQTRICEPGDFVNMGSPVFTVTLTEPVFARVFIEEQDLEKIKTGMKVKVRTDSGNSYNGQIGFISSVAEFTPKTVETRKNRTSLVYRARITIKGSHGVLKQGMPVSVVVEEGK